MDLLQNPFYILDANPRHNRQQIMELFDERSLLFDPNECSKARSDLTTPRKRLSAEVAWMPGLGPKRAAEMLSILKSSPTDLLTVDKLPPIVRANLLIAGLKHLPTYKSNEIAKWILKIALAFEKIDLEKLKDIINQDRIVAGFPEVTDISTVEAEIQEQRIYYRQVLKSVLDNLSPKGLVNAITVAVESATDVGEKQGPILIDDLVDSYEVDAQEFLNKEEENIKALVEKLRAAVEAEQPDSNLAPMVNKLIKVVQNWDIVAQPIQVSAKSRGLAHDASHRVANLVRDLAIYMFNEHNKLDFSQQLTHMLQEVFAEVVTVAERTAEDAEALKEIADLRKTSDLLDPISDFCRAALVNSIRNPNIANIEARKIINSTPQLMSSLLNSNPTVEIISSGKDIIAFTLMQCAIIYGNATKKWEPCKAFLNEALKYACAEEIKTKIQDNLRVLILNNINDIQAGASFGNAHAGQEKEGNLGCGYLPLVLLAIIFAIMKALGLQFIRLWKRWKPRGW